MAFVGVVIMQRSRPGDSSFKPLFKALHHLSCQLLHVEIAFTVLFGRVGTQIETVEIPPLFRLSINKLVGFMSSYESSTVKKWSGEFFLVPTWSLLDIADIGLCRYPLALSPRNIIRFNYGHYSLRLLLPFLLIHNPAIQLFDEVFKVR